MRVTIVARRIQLITHDLVSREIACYWARILAFADANQPCMALCTLRKVATKATAAATLSLAE